MEVAWARHLPRKKLRVGRRGLLWQTYPAALREAQLVVVEQASNLILNYRLLNAQRRGRTRVAFFGHGQNFAEGASGLGETVKAWTSRRVHWWFAYTEKAADVVAGLGYPRERITVVNNAIDTTQLATELQEVRAAGAAERLRRELGLGEGPVGVFLGTLRPSKGLDLLLIAAARIHAARDDFRLVVVGAGPMAAEVERLASQEPWLHYLGSRYGRDRAAVLALADLMLLPGWVGLVVLDAIVAGTPLITTTDSPHGPEIAYLRDRENGLLVTTGGDPARYADAVLQVLEDPVLAERLSAGCRLDAERYGLEDMTARFAEGIRQALRAPPR
jgi:L-malate glycosyltransferase